MLPVLIVTAPLIFCGLLFVLGLCKAAAKPTPPVPPAHPRLRRVQLDLDEIDWDWRREEEAA